MNIDLILANLAPSLRGLIFSLPENILETLEEIRLRKLRPLALSYRGKIAFVTARGEITSNSQEAYVVSPEELELTVQIISKSSLYAFAEELKNGFLTLPGGHRVGVGGRFTLVDGKIAGVKEIGSLNFRLAREVTGCTVSLLPQLVDPGGKPYSTLVVSPPQCGKTTFLRDLAYQFSTGAPSLGLAGSKVVIVDERSEIAGVYEGIPQMNVGSSTDVLDACPKAEGILIAVRALSPDVIITDEIGTSRDVEALQEAVNSGVRVMASVHAGSWRELEERPSLKPLFAESTFQRAVLLSHRRGPGTVEGILRLDRPEPEAGEVAEGA